MANVLEASKELLVDVTSLLKEARAEFLVVGGWSPYLLNKTDLEHPGTKDVDILFTDGAAELGLNQYVRLLLEHGFLPSAKHDFQLLKAIRVDDHELVFNVDLLHPSESVKNPELLNDHFDLHILESELGQRKFVRSMVLPSSQILFLGEFHQDVPVVAPFSKREVTIPLISPAGCILSKCESVKASKRHRDSFDIYLSLMSEGVTKVAQVLSAHKGLKGVRELLISLQEYVTAKPSTGDVNDFDARVMRFAKRKFDTLPSEEVKKLLAAI